MGGQVNGLPNWEHEATVDKYRRQVPPWYGRGQPPPEPNIVGDDRFHRRRGLGGAAAGVEAHDLQDGR